MQVEFPAEIPAVPTSSDRSRANRSSARWALARRVATLLLMAFIVVASVYAGFKLRRWTWEMTDPIHFRGDINRGYNWGREAATNGYVNLYEKMSVQEAHWGNWLDYAPLRLAVMTGWGHWTKSRFPEATRWQDDWEFNKFVLLFNTGMELLGAICAFLLVRLWLVRAHGSAKPFTGWGAGLAAGLLFWFNPATILSAHGWPTWDMWIMPMYLLAILLASHNWWFAAGVTVAAGALFKGQQLTVAPIFLIWPLIMWRFDAMAKWAAGLVFGIGLLASPWLVTYVPADALAAMRAEQATYREPWVVSDLKLPDRLVDVPAIAWVIGIAIAATVLPLLMARLRRGRSDGLIDGPDGPDGPDDAADVPNRFRSPPTALRLAAARFEDSGVWRYVALAVVAVIAVLSFALIRAGGASPAVWFWHAMFGVACITSLAVAVAISPHAAMWPVRAGGALVAVGVVVWPWLRGDHGAAWTDGLLLATLFAVVLLIIRLRNVGILAAAGVGASLLLCSTLFNGSDAWWICGWKYGTFHWPWMIMGLTSNLPGLLAERFNWPKQDTTTVVFQLPAELLLGYPKFAIDVTIKQFLAALYAVTLLLSAIGVGLQARRRDPRILIAFTAPWLMFFCFPVQIHERYLLYAAGVGAITIGAGVGPALLTVLLSIFTWIMTMHVMLGGGRGRGVNEFGRLLAETYPSLFSPTAGRTLHSFIRGTHPDIAWAILLIAGIFLYLSLMPSRPRVRRDGLIQPVE
ncbi:MAG TPA: hypothetical protein VGN72_21025 [Tepidisphaeraceae bacterium]|jgi:hypothetical protein|nr:hypothetical protein [Tepidisphaeraceae bacterium]